jgi:hypothetical protein
LPCTVAPRERDGILACDELELGVADRHCVAALGERRNLARRHEAHFLSLQERNDLPVSERRRDLHARMLTARPDALSAPRQLL